MNELFRFIQQAYPSSANPDDNILIGGDQTPFQHKIAALQNSPQAWTSLSDASQTYIGGDTFLKDLRHLHFAAQYAHIASQLANADNAGEGIDSINSLVSTAFNRSAKDVAADSNLKSDRALLDDALVALKFARDRGQYNTTPYREARRVIWLIVSAASDPKARLSASELDRLMKRPLLIAPSLVPAQAPTAPPPVLAPFGQNYPQPPSRTPTELSEEEKKIEALIARVNALEETWQTLMALQPDELELRSPAAPIPAHESVQTGRLPAKRPAATQGSLVVKTDTIRSFSEQVKSALSSLNVHPESMHLPRSLLQKQNTRRTGSAVKSPPAIFPGDQEIEAQDR